MFFEHLGAVRRGQHHMVDPGLAGLSQLVGQKRHARGRQHRLGRRQRQWAKAGALTAHQHDRVDGTPLSGLRRA